MSGAISNYNDSGYTISTSFYDQTNTYYSGGTYVSSKDIYINNPSIGIYMIDGGYDNTATIIYPIYGTVSTFSNINVPINVDNAYLVYPGYGFTLYANSSYDPSNAVSQLYYNTSSVPYVFYCDSGSSFNGKPNTCLIYSTNGPPTQYGSDKTNSIIVYYRGTQVATIFG